MAEAQSTATLYQRGLNDDEEEDIWDDTALIKAYDEAVSLVKVKVAEQNGDTGEIVNLNESGKQKRQKKKSKNKAKRRKWRVGDHCRAKFTEDGLVYEAELLSVDESAGTCYVRYVDYGNEEEHELKDLMVMHGNRSRSKKVKDSDLETDSGLDWKGTTHSPISSHSRPMTNGPSTTHHHLPPSGWSGFTHEPMMPTFAAPSFQTGFPPQPPPFSSSSRIPSMPPPPPPVFDMPEGDNEALCSMLMSWYMSGYHTGYYQGLQQGRKQSGASSPYVNR